MNNDQKTLVSMLSYVDKNPIATLSTVNTEGIPHGAVIYLCADESDRIVYFLTKQDTRKYKNLIEHDQVSLTIVNPTENSTLQAEGRAKEVRDALTIDTAMKKFNKIHSSAHDWLPPISKLRAGAYVLIAVTLTNARLAQFKGMQIGDERIFTQF